jgi:hypothetical protein
MRPSKLFRFPVARNAAPQRAIALSIAPALALWPAMPALGQTAPHAGSLLQQMQRSAVPPLSGRVDKPQAIPLPEEMPGTAGIKVQVQASRFAGNTVLPEARLQDIVVPWHDRTLDMNELRKAAAAVAEADRAAGWIARAYRPRQDVTEGPVVATGALSDVRINKLASRSALNSGGRGNLATITLASPLSLGGALNLVGGDSQLNEHIYVRDQALTIYNARALTAAAGNSISADGGFTQEGSGTNSLGGNITCNGAPNRFATDVTVRDQITINSNGGLITFDGRVTGSAVTVPARYQTSIV